MYTIELRNTYGSFNWANPTEKSTNVSLTICLDWEPYKEGELMARIGYEDDTNTVDDNIYWFDNFYIIDFLERATDYHNRIWSTHNYKGEAELFVKIFNENKEEIFSSWKDKRLENLNKEIERVNSIKLKDI